MDQQRRSVTGRGQALVEFAVIVPFLLVLVMGLIDLGMALQAKIAITNAAREGARLAARGNIFSDAQVLQVVRDQSRGVDIASNATVLLTTVRCSASGVDSYTTATLIGSAPSRFSQTALAALQQQLTSSEPDYLGHEEIVVLEIEYRFDLVTGMLGATLPMYTYTVMPVSAPS